MSEAKVVVELLEALLLIGIFSELAGRWVLGKEAL